MPDTRWQWISEHFGPMGWFTPQQKAQHERTRELRDGHWRLVPPDEVAAFYRYVADLAHAQA